MPFGDSEFGGRINLSAERELRLLARLVAQLIASEVARPDAPKRGVAYQAGVNSVRRFLVLQALLVWQGGFFFYAAVVVPTGTSVLGTFEQGSVTRHVTVWLNAIGAGAIAVFAWDQFATRAKWRWAPWGILFGCLVTLAILHPQIESRIDFGPEGRVREYTAFYQLHRVYLYVSTLQWLAGLWYAAIFVRDQGFATVTKSGSAA